MRSLASAVLASLLAFVATPAPAAIFYNPNVPVQGPGTCTSCYYVTYTVPSPGTYLHWSDTDFILRADQDSGPPPWFAGDTYYEGNHGLAQGIGNGYYGLYDIVQGGALNVGMVQSVGIFPSASPAWSNLNSLGRLAWTLYTVDHVTAAPAGPYDIHLAWQAMPDGMNNIAIAATSDNVHAPRPQALDAAYAYYDAKFNISQMPTVTAYVPHYVWDGSQFVSFTSITPNLLSYRMLNGTGSPFCDPAQIESDVDLAYAPIVFNGIYCQAMIGQGALSSKPPSVNSSAALPAGVVSMDSTAGQLNLNAVSAGRYVGSTDWGVAQRQSQHACGNDLTSVGMDASNNWSPNTSCR